MARYTERNILKTEGLTFRELFVNGDSGFVLRVMDREVEPPKVTTVVHQPGQDLVTLESLSFVSTQHKTWGGKWRYDPPVPTEPATQERVIELLKASESQVALSALQHLVAAPAIVQR